MAVDVIKDSMKGNLKSPIPNTSTSTTSTSIHPGQIYPSIHPSLPPSSNPLFTCTSDTLPFSSYNMNNSYNSNNRNMEQLRANCNHNITSGSSNKRDQTSTPDPKQDPENLSNNNNMDDALQLQEQDAHLFAEDLDSTCSTPYVSAPSSPGHNGPINGGFFYSCPASPMHFAITSTAAAVKASYSSSSSAAADEFEFSARFGSSGSDQPGSMSSADELFLNGQIRPMKLSSHLERPQVLAPLLDLENEDEEENEGKSYYESARGRDLRVVRDKSLRRRTRSMSPFRTTSFEFVDDDDEDSGNTHKGKNVKNESCGGSLQVCDESINKIEEEASSSSTTTTPSVSASSSRSSSAGRNSKRWVFLKDFLYRSKSEGRSNNKFWSNISFSPAKEKGTGKSTSSTVAGSVAGAGVSKDKGSNGSSSVGVMEGSGQKVKGGSGSGGQSSGKKPVNGVGKKKVPASPHELHYKASRAQAEEMRKKTYLPYRQGLLGCLGFSSKGYGAMNGIARALNPVSSR